MEISVCVGSACHLKGSYQVIENLKECVAKHNLEDKITIKAAFCLNHCTEAVSVKLGDSIYSVNPDNAEEFFNKNILGK